jgi:site-specific DNA-methyltransferase (cytosine-N4-specific)
MKKIDDIIKIDHIHSYPAKYTVEMLEYYIKKYTKETHTILDPFVGSGTTLLAARWYGRKSVGFDINPVAYQISKVKTNTYSNKDYDKFKKFVEDITFFFDTIDDQTFEIVHYNSIEHWFRKKVIFGLSAIRHCIKIYNKEEKMSDLYYLAFSNVILPLSNQESDTRYSAKNKGDISLDTILNLYLKKLNEMFKMVILSEGLYKHSKVYLMDSNLIKNTLKKNSVDLLITSPPYPNTYDYYLYHKHRMLWLGYDFKPVMEQEIGSRREFSSLKKKADKFTDDLYKILASANYSLKKGAHIVIVIGDGKIAGEKYESRKKTLQIAEKLNWKLIEEKYTELDKTSRNFQQSFRTKGKKEYFLVFEKVEEVK